MIQSVMPMSRPSFDLATWQGRLDIMRQKIIEAETIQESLRLADAAGAVLTLFKASGALLADQNRVARMKLDAERKMGHSLQVLEKARNQHGSEECRSHDVTGTSPTANMTYADLAKQCGLGLSAFKMCAARVQLIAAIPHEVYTRELDSLTQTDRLITSSHFVSLGRKLRHTAVRRSAAAAVMAPHGAVRVGDFRNSLDDLPDRSVSLILTDPPYDKEALALYADLSRLAERVLIDGGSLVCYAAQWAVPLILPTMHHLRYQWMFAIRHSGGHRRQHGWKVRVAWKPLLWFVKGAYQGEYLLDLLDSRPGDKALHDWAQGCGEAAYLVEKLCPETGLVLDPMCGSGTTLFAAERLSRRFLGVEIDRDRALVASSRLSR